MTRAKVILVAVAVILGVAVEFILARWVRSEIALAYALVLGALLLASLVRGLRYRLPPAVRFERLLAQPAAQRNGVEQLRTFERDLRLAVSSDGDVYYRLRPMVREIASVLLARRHGIDLDREPARAEAAAGAGRVWELIRPGLEPPADRLARSWSPDDIEQLVDELERL